MKNAAKAKAEAHEPLAVRPLQARVWVEREDEAPISKGGIHIPDAARGKQGRGTVIAVGPGRMLKDGTVLPVDVQVGDKVVFARYAGNEVKVKVQEAEYVVLQEDDILGVLED